ncbi:MAG: hypothetical protein M3Q40_00875 [Pseudomonadota bacterium]|nr:hypothetical protein [Pseudomonadota bacterium]
MLPWLLLLVALAALVVAFKTTSMLVLVIALLLALAMAVAAVMGLLSRRVGDRARDASLMLDPEELRRLREQGEARKVQAAAVSQERDPRH